MENELPKSGDAIDADKSKRISYNPDSVFGNKSVSYFGEAETLKGQYQEFVGATGGRKLANSVMVIFFFLLVEALIVANYPPVREFVVLFFSLRR